jgi:hypothetical protein
MKMNVCQNKFNNPKTCPLLASSPSSCAV